MLEQKSVNSIAALVRKDIDNRRLNAGYSGSWGDDGAANLQLLLDAWLAGIAQRVPAEFHKYEAQAELAEDVDYATYVRLHKKFGKPAS